jgi:hypothetical protein
VLLKSRLQNSKKGGSTGIFPLTRIPIGFVQTSRSQFTLIRLSTATGRSRFPPIRPTTSSAVCSDRPDSVHTDPAHGCFSRSLLPTLSLILNKNPTNSRRWRTIDHCTRNRRSPDTHESMSDPFRRHHAVRIPKVLQPPGRGGSCQTIPVHMGHESWNAGTVFDGTRALHDH